MAILVYAVIISKYWNCGFDYTGYQAPWFLFAYAIFMGLYVPHCGCPFKSNSSYSLLSLSLRLLHAYTSRLVVLKTVWVIPMIFVVTIQICWLYRHYLFCGTKNYELTTALGVARNCIQFKVELPANSKPFVWFPGQYVRVTFTGGCPCIPNEPKLCFLTG